MIKKDTIRNIIDVARVDEVISEFVTLKKRGSNMVGLCPFHNEKTPSFSVSPSKGIYKCFGCGRAGDVIRFIMEHEQLTYPESLRYLAGKYDVEIEEEYRSEKDKEDDSIRESLYVVNKYASEYFHQQLMENEKGRAIAHSYLIDRGFDEKMMTDFSIGYCQDEYNEFSKAALEKGYKEEYLEKTGLSIVKDGKQFDRFRGRVIFPIHNLSGRIIGFGGRTLRTDKKIAKYVNSPESDIYNKSRELYGLYYAKKDMVKEDICYVVEGYTDVISLAQSGITNAVAPLGTSLTEDQIKLIRRYTTNVVLLFDGDEAGLKAAARAVDMVLEAGLNVYIINFPEGEDPDTYSKSHSNEELKEFLEGNKRDFISFNMEMNGENWMADPIKKAEVMKTILNSISKIPDHLLRSLFIKDFSQKTGIEEKSAIYELNRIRRKNLKKPVQREDTIPEPQDKFAVHNEEEKDRYAGSRDAKEQKIIELLFKFGNEKLKFEIKGDETEKEEIEINVGEYIIGEIERDDVAFRNEVFNKIIEAYKIGVEAENPPSERDFLEHEDDSIRQMSYDLLASEYSLSDNWKEKYHIYTKLEETDLKISVTRALYALKLSEVLLRLNEFEEKMKTASEDELGKLITQQQRLSEAKRALAGKLGMTIT
jgi:DNA primase